MGFDQSSIVEVLAPIYRAAETRLSWTSTAPQGTFFQVYLDGRLAWWGTARSCSLPTGSSVAHVDVGAVGAGEERTSFAASLPPRPSRRVLLTWSGGTYLDPSLEGFAVYQGVAPSQPPDMAAPVATVNAYPSGLIQDGFGVGGFGQGGFGQSAGDYSWTSPPLDAGWWGFAVAASAQGDSGSATTVWTLVAAPPRPPAPASDGSRLRYVHNATAGTITLSWNPSPSSA